jgi:long-chain acyl-CoA synthetase
MERDGRSDRDGTLRTLIREIAARGAHPALQWIDREKVAALSSAELADLAHRLAAGLIREGIAAGEPILLIAPNSAAWVVARLAVGAAGGVAVALDDLASEAEIAETLRLIPARRAFAAARHMPVLRRLAGDRLDVVALDENAQDSPVEGARPWRSLLADAATPLPDLDASADAMIVTTSGTTGAPKHFALTTANIWANLRVLVGECLVGPRDRVLMPLPLHHVYPLVVGLLTPLHGGATVVLTESAGGPDVLKALRLAKPTAIVGVPRLYAAVVAGLEARIAGAGRLAVMAYRTALTASAWMRRTFGLNLGRVVFGALRRRIGSELHLLVSGGAHLEPDVLWPLVGLGFEVRSGYGLAETASIFTGNVPRRERLGSEGRPFEGGELRIAEPNEDGIGEIQLRGPNVFSGYRDNDEANRTAFTADGWFRTGDLGRVDADRFLYVTGRTKEVLVLGGGKKVNPEALEKHYGANPALQEIAILERDGALVALVVPDMKAVREIGGKPEDVVRVALAEAARALPSYQRTAGFALARESLPRTRLGKLRRFLLPELYERTLRGGTRPAPGAPTAEDLALIEGPRARQIWSLLAQRYPQAPLSPRANLQLDLGIDSLEWVSLLLVIEQRFGWRLPEDEIGHIETVRDLLTLAEREGGAPAPTAPIDTRWIEPTGPLLTTVGAAFYWIGRILMRTLFRVSATGRENVPAHGSFILVANHASDLDALAFAAALPLATMRRIYWGGASRLGVGGRLAPFWRAIHVMPVDERLPAATLALPVAVLKRGDCLAWFPEGWRTPDGRMLAFQPGIGRIVAETGATVIPAFISGSFEALPRDRRVPRLHPIRIRFGRPIAANVLADQGHGTTEYERIADALRQAVLDLADENDRRG